MAMFRTLRADEIECRIGTINKGGITLLLYKDARCDQTLLDETVGEMNWQKRYTRDNKNCIVSIWDNEKKQWIEKEDTGTESYTEKEKGLASDSFKRACVNWGIGRELYTAPNIFLRGVQTVKNGDNRYILKNPSDQYGYTVKSIGYEDGKITALEIEKDGVMVFSFGGKTVEVPSASDTINESQAKRLVELVKMHGKDGANWLMEELHVARLGEITNEQYADIVMRFQ